jgi:hypothetical protein
MPQSCVALSGSPLFHRVPAFPNGLNPSGREYFNQSLEAEAAAQYLQLLLVAANRSTQRVGNAAEYLPHEEMAGSSCPSRKEPAAPGHFAERTRRGPSGRNHEIRCLGHFQHLR